MLRNVHAAEAEFLLGLQLIDDILSEFKLIESGEKDVSVPFVKLIGMVLADNCICDGYVEAVKISSKSCNPQTSIYPPIFNTEKVLPNTAVLLTDNVDDD